MKVLPVNKKQCLIKLKDDQGSATVEAMLVFPVIFSTILVMMLATIYVYEYLYVQYASSTAAERSSYSWDNQDRAYGTGQLVSNRTYGLYEEELLVSLLSNVIALPSNNASEQALQTNSSSEHGYSGHLVQDRLRQANQYLSHSISPANGRLSFKYDGILPKVTVSIQKNNTPLYWNQIKLLSPPHYTAQYTVFAPTQYIRNIDLLIFYTSKLMNMSPSEQRKWKSGGEKASKAFSS